MNEHVRQAIHRHAIHHIRLTRLTLVVPASEIVRLQIELIDEGWTITSRQPAADRLNHVQIVVEHTDQNLTRDTLTQPAKYTRPPTNNGYWSGSNQQSLGLDPDKKDYHAD